jgi:hypothetical protein
MIADAAVTGGSIHVVHIGSSGSWQVPVLLEMIDDARSAPTPTSRSSTPMQSSTAQRSRSRDYRRPASCMSSWLDRS